MEQTKYLFSMLSPEFRDELREVVRDTNFEVIQELKKNADPQVEFVNQKTLKQMLGVGQDVLDEMIVRGLPAYKVGRQVMYKISEVEEVITEKYRVH